MGGAFWSLAGSLFGWGASKVAQLMANRAITVGIGSGAITAGVVTLDDLRNQAALQAGATGPQGLEEAARTVARMLGLGGDRVLWPVSNRTGLLIPAKYFHLSLVTGRAWITSTYISTRRRRFTRRRWGGYGRGSWGGRGGAGNTTVVT